MNILIDTHILLWWLAGDSRLSAEMQGIIGDSEHMIFVSSVVVWEIVIKKALGKLVCPDNIVDIVRDNGFQEIPITSDHAQAIGQLPSHHHDPFDRLLIAQALHESYPLMTVDSVIQQYPIRCIPSP